MPNEEQPKFDMTKALVLDFTPQSERWSAYKLSDGGTLKARTVLTGAVRLTERDPLTGEPHYRWTHNDQFYIMASPSLRDSPSEGPITAERVQQSIAESVDVEAKGAEQWTVYNLSDGSVLRLRLEIQKVFRTTLHDTLGNPVYGFGSTNLHRIRINPKLVERPQATAATPGPYG